MINSKMNNTRKMVYDEFKNEIIIHTNEDFVKMRKAGSLAAKVLDFIEHQNVGRLKVYSTTEKFKKYFGVQGDADTLGQKLFKKVRTRNSAKIITPAHNIS